MLKKLLLALGAVVVFCILIIAVLAFTVPTGFNVERNITINKPKAEVFQYLKSMKNQNDWGPWYKRTRR